MSVIFAVGFIVWMLKDAVQDNIRAARGDAPRAARPGLRGYLDDRFKALADRHHKVEESGLISQLDAWAYKRHLGRKKALKVAGFKTDEAIAKAAYAHRARMALIEQGIDPDTSPASPVPNQTEPAEPPVVLTDEPKAETTTTPEPVEDGPGVSIDGHFYDNVEVWLNPEYFPPKHDDTDPQPSTNNQPESQEQPWSPFESDSTTDTKETAMSNNGEITGPAAVLQFHNDLKASLDGAAAIVDVLNGLAYELEGYAKETGKNITATETAAAGMEGLGMTAAAAAAKALMETQQTIQTALAEAAAIKERAAVIADQITASQAHLATIKAAHDGQLAVQEARAGAGHGNLADDDFLDGND